MSSVVITGFGAVTGAGDEEAFRADVKEVMSNFVADDGGSGYGRNASGGPICVGDFIGGLMLRLADHGIALRGDVAASLLTITISEGLILQLDPDFDIIMAALPYFVRFHGWSSAQAVIQGEE